MINYQRFGQGKTLVLLHGFCENLSVWDNLKEELATFCEVISIDLPGFGNSPLRDSNFTIDQIANRVESLLTSIGVDQYSVAGHSLGGYVALSLANQYPHKLDKLALLHSTALADSEQKKENRNKVITFIENHGVDSFLGQFVPSLFNPFNVADQRQNIELVKAMGSQLTAETIIGYTKAMRDRPDRTNILSSKSVDFAFIYGEKDGVFQPEDIKAQTDLIDQNRVFSLKKSGHMGMYEEPENMLECLKIFLR